jgi:sugar lactone lactonase YvrE
MMIPYRFFCMFLMVPALMGQTVQLGSSAASYPRVEYLRMVTSVRQFSKPRGFFSKLVSWVSGPKQDNPELVRPYAMAEDSTGRLLVADPGQHGIHLFDLEERKYDFLKGPRDKQLESPVDVDCDDNDDIYVSDSVRQRIYVFDSRGRYLRTIGGDSPETSLARPTGLALDRKARRVYVTDTLKHQIAVFGMDDGSLVQVIGKRGQGAGEFNYPTALTLSAGKLYVVDAMNFRIQTFSLDGQYRSSFGRPGISSGTLYRPKGIAADTDGNLYVVDALFETVQVFDPSGQFLYYFGSTGTEPGQFQLPAGISIDSHNIIYVADSQNRRIQVFRYRRAGQ